MQRCAAHKLRSAQAKAPVHWREEPSEGRRRMIYAETAAAGGQARTRFTQEFQLRRLAVGASLREAGDDLFAFVRLPAAQWKALRTTNALERINDSAWNVSYHVAGWMSKCARKRRGCSGCAK